MREDKTLIDDLMKLGENALGNLLGARHEFGAQARTGLEGLTRRLDLVTRAEFDAAFAMLAKARTMQEDMNERISAIETILNLSSAPKATAKKKNVAKVNLPIVKQHNLRKRLRS